MWLHTYFTKKIFVSFLFLTVWLGIAVGQSCLPETEIDLREEKIVYKLYYNWGMLWIPAGEATFYVADAGDAYHIDVYGKSFDSYSAIFNVNNRYTSHIDKESFLPTYFVRTVKENKYTRYDSLIFNRPNNEIIKFQGKTEQQAKWTSDAITSCTHDLVSLLYYLRTFRHDNLVQGQHIETSMYFDDKAYPIGLVVGNTRNKYYKSIDRKIRSIEVQPTTIAGDVFKEDGIMSVWVSNDKLKLPLEVSSPLLVGSIKAQLTYYKKGQHVIK